MKACKLNSIPFLICLGIWTLSCETIIDVDLPQHVPALVVNSTFSNSDTTFIIQLSETTGILEQEDYYSNYGNVNGGLIELFENDQPIGIATQQENGLYYFPYTPKTNNKYTIKASKEGYALVNATDKVPAINKTLTIEELDQSNDEFNLSFSFNDPEESNYYLVDLYAVEPYYDYYYDEDTSYQIYLGDRLQKLFYQEEGADFDEFENYNESRIFSDELFNGQKFNQKINFYYYPYYQNIDGNQSEEATRFVLQLKNVSDAYYRYSITKYNQSSSQDNPFAEPAQVYNNIENGYGIFASFGSYEIEFDANFN